jgi:OOP family OmpA-OmpF porin
MGVEQNRINAIGKGESEPKADNGTEEGRLMNRRVEVQLEQTSVEERKTIRKP